MSISRLAELQAELKSLQTRIHIVKAEIGKEQFGVREIFPTDWSEKTAAHAEKYATTPPPKKGPATISEYFQGK